MYQFHFKNLHFKIFIFKKQYFFSSKISFNHENLIQEIIMTLLMSKIKMRNIVDIFILSFLLSLDRG